MKLETRKKKEQRRTETCNVARFPLGAQENGENELGQKAGFASVQRCFAVAEKEPALGTRLLEERSELALKRVRRDAWDQLGWVK
jgi:hypothetical protein